MKTTIAVFASIWLASAAVAATWPDIDSSEQKQARIDREQELYDEGSEALDDHDYRHAARAFARVAEMKGAHADAALYWLADAQAKMGESADALNTIVQLRKAYSQSKWVNDANQLELEIRQHAGEPMEPGAVKDEDLKLMAINGLMQSDPDRAVPILEHLVQSSNSKKIKDRAMFVLSQSSSQKAYDAMARIAKSGSPETQRLAIRYLGISGNEHNRALLSDIYNTTADMDVKKSVLKAYMISGDRARVLGLAKTEPNAELRADAVMQLGIMGARAELADLYSSENAVDVRKKIIQAMFIGGNAEKLAEIARTEPVLELKLTAIKNLGLLGGGRAGNDLVDLYHRDAQPEVRRTIINALFIQGNARSLVDLARGEKDPELKKNIVEKLSLMNSKDATDYLMEYLKQ